MKKQVTWAGLLALGLFSGGIAVGAAPVKASAQTFQRAPRVVGIVGSGLRLIAGIVGSGQADG